MIEIEIVQEQGFLEILSLLNETASDLQAKGNPQWEVPWPKQELFKDIQLGRIYAVTLKRQLIGSFGLKEKSQIRDRALEPGSLYLYQLALHPKFQGLGLGEKILERIKNDFPIIYLDCWAGNEKLRRFYSLNGFEFLRDVPEEDFFVSVFRHSC